MIEISLKQGQVALIDDIDMGAIAPFNWYANGMPGHLYAISNFKKPDGTTGLISMHRAVLRAGPGLVVDHVNGDTLDNRRDNLRVASVFQNQHNRHINHNNKSGYKGVYWCRSTRRWRAEIRAYNKKYHLGYFDSAQEGHIAYCKAALELHKEFARVS